MASARRVHALDEEPPGGSINSAFAVHAGTGGRCEYLFHTILVVHVELAMLLQGGSALEVVMFHSTLRASLVVVLFAGYVCTPE